VGPWVWGLLVLGADLVWVLELQSLRLSYSWSVKSAETGRGLTLYNRLVLIMVTNWNVRTPIGGLTLLLVLVVVVVPLHHPHGLVDPPQLSLELSKLVVSTDDLVPSEELVGLFVDHVEKTGTIHLWSFADLERTRLRTGLNLCRHRTIDTYHGSNIATSCTFNLKLSPPHILQIP